MPDAPAGTRPPPDPATDSIEFLPLPAWVAAPDGACVAVNCPWRELTGQTPEQAAGRGWLAAVHPDDANAVAERWTRAVAAGEVTGRRR